MQEQHWSSECQSEWTPFETGMPTTWRAGPKLNVGFSHLVIPRASFSISLSFWFWLAGQREYRRGLWPSSLTAVGMSAFIWKVCPFKSCHSTLGCVTNALHFLRCLSLLVESSICVPLCAPAAADKQHKLPCHNQTCPVFQLRKRREVVGEGKRVGRRGKYGQEK